MNCITIKSIVIGLMLTALSVLPLKAQTPAAEHPDDYIPMLKNKNIGLVANHSSRVGEKRLLDALIENGISVLKIYSPEHGFRGTATEGEAVNHSADEKTGISIISLYGANKKPTAKQLNGIDCMVFDMQDVGTRFYTYLSTMHYVMEACAENNIPLIVLDRPNPNGFYIDGPILEPAQKSFVGMHPIPIVHGMTLGELAQMINGEGWLSDKLQCMLTVITCKNYTHQSLYKLPVRPSPNLPNMTAVYLYPTLCLFEGTVLSVGRGAGFPFQVYGHPNYEEKKGYEFVFTPRGTKGSSKPVLDGKTCYGVDLRECNALEITNGQIQLDWIIDAYKNFSPQDKFFSKFFDTLSGNTLLRRQIENGKTAGEIRKSWKKGLDNFKQSRKKYLLYDE